MKKNIFFAFFLLGLLRHSYAEQVVTGALIGISNVGPNSAPQLVVAGNGNAMALWLNFPNFIQTAWYNRTLNTWTAPTTLAQGSAPVIDIDFLGNAIIVYVDPTNDIIAARFDVPTQSFSFTQLSLQGTINISPRVSVNDFGVAVAVWIQNTPFQVLSSSFNTTTLTWSAPTIFLNGTFPAEFENGTFPADFEIDNFSTGIAIVNDAPTGQIQTATIAIVP